MGQDKLLMLIMSQNIFLSPAVSRSEFLLCLKNGLNKEDRLGSSARYQILCNIVDFVPIEERNIKAK